MQLPYHSCYIEGQRCVLGIRTQYSYLRMSGDYILNTTASKHSLGILVGGYTGEKRWNGNPEHPSDRDPEHGGGSPDGMKLRG